MKLSELREVIRTISRNKFYESLNEANVTRTYKAFMALKHKVKQLEEKQLDMLAQWKSIKDPTKRGAIQNKMKIATKELQKQRGYLNKLEDNFINKMSYDDSYSE